MLPFYASANAQAISPYPALKKGLWEIVTTDSSSPDFKATELRCVGGANQERRTAKKEFADEIKNCRVLTSTSSKEKISLVRECKKDGGLIMTLKINIEGNFSSRFERSANPSFNIPTGLEGLTHTTIYRFVGACPKSMKAGDTITTYPDGGSSNLWNRYSIRKQ